MANMKRHENDDIQPMKSIKQSNEIDKTDVREGGKLHNDRKN